MTHKNTNYITIKWLLSLTLAIICGNFVMNTLENINVNIWSARILGAIVCGMIGLLMHQIWIKKKN